MELIFIRHGQGEHTINIPDSLQIHDPSLTIEGVKQAENIQLSHTLSNQDLLVVSPTRRTLQTAQIWSVDCNCKKLVTPLVAPRIFPWKENGKTLPCDRLLDREVIIKEFKEFQLDTSSTNELWIDGINTMRERDFRLHAKLFINWCKLQEKERIFIVSHDGTITSYRQFLSCENLSREDFPKETDFFIWNVI